MTIQELVESEKKRQQNTINLIASENFMSDDVSSVLSSSLNAKYAEGYPGKRYYSGCKIVDEIESEVIAAACKLFGCAFANVQPHSGTQANIATFIALAPFGSTIMYLSLECGGHISHGALFSLTGKLYKTVPFFLNEKNEIDYKSLCLSITTTMPKILVVGFSSYPLDIDFKSIHECCKSIGCFLVADISHVSGLVATKEFSNPFPYADVVTSTTHKTLRGPRGGIILSNNYDIISKINSCVFPLIQSGPSIASIAAKGIAINKAMQPDFKEYVIQLKKNCKVMFSFFKNAGWDTVTQTTDTHMFLLNTVKSIGIKGSKCASILEDNNIIVNKNFLPGDTKVCSGIRIGTAAMTTRGMTEKNSIELCEIILKCLNGENMIFKVYEWLSYCS